MPTRLMRCSPPQRALLFLAPAGGTGDGSPPHPSLAMLAPPLAHRRVSRFPSAFASENRDTSSKSARFIRHWRRFADFPSRGRQGAFYYCGGGRNAPHPSLAMLAPPLAHRRVSRFPSAVASENRDTSSKSARFIRHWRRFAGFPSRGRQGAFYYCGGGRNAPHLVVARCAESRAALRAALARSAAPPLPTETASLGFRGGPIVPFGLSHLPREGEGSSPRRGSSGRFADFPARGKARGAGETQTGRKASP